MRRGVLSIACLGICITGVTSPRASETQVEVAGYEGNTAGAWACGPQANVRYGGLAGKVRHSQRQAGPNQGAGATVVAGFAMEYARAKSDVDLSGVDTTFADVFGAGDLRGGYHWHYVGVEIGATLWSGWRDPGIKGLAIIPEVVLSFGPRDFIYGEVGVGTPTLTWLTRPAVPYLGLGIVPSKRVRFELHAGLFRAGPGLIDDQALLVDATWFVPIKEHWDLRGSLAFGTGFSDRQASLGFAYGL